MWFIVVMSSRLTRLLANFSLNEAWLARAEGVCVGLYFMLGRTGFVLVVDAHASFVFVSRIVVLSLFLCVVWLSCLVSVSVIGILRMQGVRVHESGLAVIVEMLH